MKYTEKQTEAWLEQETRILTMPDGSTRPLRAFRLVWDTVDSLISLSGRTIEELVGYAVEEAALQSKPFDVTFVGVVSWLGNQQRAYLGL